MNKGDLIAQIVDDTGISKAQANAALNSFTNAVSKALIRGDKVTIVDFGTFSVFVRSERVGRNPQKKDDESKITIPAKRVAKFKAGKELSLNL